MAFRVHPSNIGIRGIHRWKMVDKHCRSPNVDFCCLVTALLQINPFRGSIWTWEHSQTYWFGFFSFGSSHTKYMLDYIIQHIFHIFKVWSEGYLVTICCRSSNWDKDSSFIIAFIVWGGKYTRYFNSFVKERRAVSVISPRDSETGTSYLYTWLGLNSCNRIDML